MSRPDRLALAVESGAVPIPDSGPVLVLRAAPSAVFALLDPGRVTAEQSFRPTHDRLLAEAPPGLTVVPEAAPADGAAALAVVNATRSRAETLGNVARALAALGPDGVLVLDGAKTDGIDSLRGLIGAILPVEGSFAKAHGKVLWLRRPATLPAAVSAWADAAALAPNAEGMLAAPGMFSHRAADPGSALLAAQLPAARLAGRVAELGAAWGWLASRALAAAPGITSLDLYEAEAGALAAARANLTDPRAAFHWADATRLGAEVGPYDAVIANPPFHQGRDADPGLGAAFIAAAARILKPSGRLLLVANRQLPYEASLAARFRAVERIEQDRAFKVFLARQPIRAARQAPPRHSARL